MTIANCLEEQGGISMFRKLLIGALGAMAVLFSTTAFAQGTASDAKAMLEKTVAAIKADKANTLDQINKGENGFLVGDLYPFCFNLSDALLVAVGNPNVKGLLGKDARTLKDPTGDVYGPRLYDAAKEGQVNEVSYMSPKAGADKTWVPKASFVTAVACQSALEWDPLSASKRDPFDRRVLMVAIAASELAGVAETARARVV